MRKGHNPAKLNKNQDSDPLDKYSKLSFSSRFLLFLFHKFFTVVKAIQGIIEAADEHIQKHHIVDNNNLEPDHDLNNLNKVSNVYPTNDRVNANRYSLSQIVSLLYSYLFQDSLGWVGSFK